MSVVTIVSLWVCIQGSQEDMMMLHGDGTGSTFILSIHFKTSKHEDIRSRRVRYSAISTEDHARVCELFVEGALGYAPAPQDDPDVYNGIQKYLKESLGGDLDSIEATYMGSGGQFWVATTPEDPQVVATVGLEKKEDGTGLLRRLAVVSSHRRHGLAVSLVKHLEEWAKAHGFQTISLKTNCSMAPAIKLYDRLGYQRVRCVTIREEPHFYVLWFEKRLDGGEIKN